MATQSCQPLQISMIMNCTMAALMEIYGALAQVTEVLAGDLSNQLHSTIARKSPATALEILSSTINKKQKRT